MMEESGFESQVHKAPILGAIAGGADVVYTSAETICSGAIFNIQRYSTHDGPGIRTVVFLKGCSLSCRWCQNPEGQSQGAELLYNPELCMACGLCRQRHPHEVEGEEKQLRFRRDSLSAEAVADLADTCPTKAIAACCEERSVEDIVDIVCRDLPYYRRSGGGLTLSGGEPFAQPKFARSILESVHVRGIHTAVETCLSRSWKSIAPSLPFLDLVLADIKHVDAIKFHDWTGGRVDVALDNFRRLASSGVETVARVALIPEFNADRDAVTRIVDFISGCNQVKQVDFLAYHTLGKNKYSLLGRPYHAGDTPLRDPALLQFAQDYAERKGLATVIGG
jgi:pyruvate formate lyase activating enzyme